MDMYLLYKFQYKDVGEGGERVLVSLCHAQDERHAKWQFKLMGFDVEHNNYSIEKISPFDDDGFMFVMPDYLIPD